MKRIKNWFLNISDRTVFIVLVVIAFASLAFSALSHWVGKNVDWWSWIDSAFQNFSTEMLGAIVTFGMFELIVGRRKERETQVANELKEKKDLIFQLRSQNHMTVYITHQRLVETGWLYDGSLQQANLAHARLSMINLANSNLREANLDGASLCTSLTNCDLQYANLHYADLKGADLRGANLYQASLEWVRNIHTAKFDSKTVLPDAQPLVDEYGNWQQDETGNYLYDKYYTDDTDMSRYTDNIQSNFWHPSWADVHYAEG